MKPKKLLLVDSAINFILGILLLAFSEPVIGFLGVPQSNQYFYPNVLGAVLVGIAVALLVEYFRKPGGMAGLGVGGAISINLCGATVLLVWLISGGLEIPFRGQMFLWSICILVFGVSVFEYLAQKRTKNKT